MNWSLIYGCLWPGVKDDRSRSIDSWWCVSDQRREILISCIKKRNYANTKKDCVRFANAIVRSFMVSWILDWYRKETNESKRFHETSFTSLLSSGITYHNMFDSLLCRGQGGVRWFVRTVSKLLLFVDFWVRIRFPACLYFPLSLSELQRSVSRPAEPLILRLHDDVVYRCV